MTRDKLAFIYWYYRFDHRMRVSLNPLGYVQTPQVRSNEKPRKLTPIYWRKRFKEEYRSYN